jgi:chemotaxis protein MotB
MTGKWTQKTMVGLTGLTLLFASGGCASKDKSRISMLEDANRNLTERLNLTRGELETRSRDEAEMNRRLQSALADVSALRDQLAAQPIPQDTASGWTAVPGGAMIAIDGRVLFAPGKATLRNEARKTLDSIRSTIQGEYADKDVLVIGHTDNQPIKKSGWADNYQLSTERALAVVRHLREQGVAPARLLAGGFGENRPRVENTSMSNRAANRRVEIFALDPQLYGTR